MREKPCRNAVLCKDFHSVIGALIILSIFYLKFYVIGLLKIFKINRKIIYKTLSFTWFVAWNRRVVTIYECKHDHS